MAVVISWKGTAPSTAAVIHVSVAKIETTSVSVTVDNKK
jgi:hypothetical protein